MNEFQQEEVYRRAKKKVDKLKGFYGHLAAYVIVNIFIIALVALGNNDKGESFWSFGTFATAIFWGIGLAFHALSVFGFDFVLGKNWEENKIKDIMEKDKREMQKWE